MIRNNYNKIVSILMTNIAFIIFFNKVLYDNIFKNHNELRIFIIIMIVMINFLFLMIAKIIYSNDKNEFKNLIDKIKYKFIEEQDNAYKHNRHDIKNYLLLIYEMINQKKYDEATEYLSEFIKNVDNTIIKVETGIDIIDILLYSKINFAKKKGIFVNIMCKTEIKCSKKSIGDLASLLGNILDNAIEACDNIKGNKLVDIEIESDPLDYVFSIKNTFNNKKNQNVDKFFIDGFSTKGPGRGHGLSNVKSIVRKYDGNVSTKIENGLFEIKIELPKYKLSFIDF